MAFNAEELLLLRRLGIASKERALAEAIVTELRAAKKVSYKDGYNAGQQAERKAQTQKPSFFRGPQ